MRSEWVGFKHFYDFFTTPDFFRLIENTITISVTNLIVGFPAPIIFALCLNEIRQLRFKKIVQTLTYLPHFISLVVICGMITGFVNSGGIISKALSPIIGENINMLTLSNMFVPIYVISDIWQGIGWSSIIYIAALSGIDSQLYEAAKIDGAGKWRQLFNITLPCLSPTIVILLILRIGGLLNVGFEKIVLLYNPLIYEASDVISTYVYRLGFENQQWSYTTAVGLLNSLINFGLLISANYISRKVNGASLW
jgi:putative aldouronate transport system permease protein